MKWIGKIFKFDAAPAPAATAESKPMPRPLRRKLVKRIPSPEIAERDRLFQRLSAFPKIQKSRVVW